MPASSMNAQNMIGIPESWEFERTLQRGAQPQDDSHYEKPSAINPAVIRETILANIATLTSWMEACLLIDRNWDSEIPDLFRNYENYCRHGDCRPLPRKTWIAVLKLAGVVTKSGTFSGLRIR